MNISDHYRIKQRLGKQIKRKFGEVYLVEHKITGELSVLKAASKITGNNQLINRIRLESTFSFEFPGLPRTLLFDESEDGVHYIRAYASGLPLDEYWSDLRRKERLPFLTSLMTSLEPIFTHLQNAGIVHCDIKPSNILIDSRNGKIHAHLIDFGLAVKQSDLEDRKIIFPLGFAAPELLLNHLDLLDASTDIYSLGITLWRLYTGKLPLTHPNPSIFTNLQLTHPIPEHSEIPSKIFKLIAKMSYKHSFQLPPNKMKVEEVRAALTNAKQHRYQNLQEVLNVLEIIKKKSWW